MTTLENLTDVLLLFFESFYVSSASNSSEEQIENPIWTINHEDSLDGGIINFSTKSAQAISFGKQLSYLNQPLSLMC